MASCIPKTQFLTSANILFKILNYKGVINIGGKIQSPYNFGKEYNKNLKKISEMFQSNRYGKVKIKTSRIKKVFRRLPC